MNCDRIARLYRCFEYAAFGRELERRRFHYLRDVDGARNVLMVGEGDGRFLARFARVNPQSSIWYIDSSARMLELARARAGKRGICYSLGDALAMPLPNCGCDLVVTHFFLDCFNAEQQETVIARLANASSCDSKWLISEFRQPASGPAASWARVWLRLLYCFFGVATHLRTRSLADHRPILARYGFRLESEEISRFGLLTSELWARHSGPNAQL
ncbi:MAG: class I SAM-dependent methyltransferase [Bryobacterales bacterium]|nr:class I SAM-dependent methyltransferase [Bryobacterales bacterium]